MKKAIILLLAMCAVVNAGAQKVTVKSLSAADKKDLTARREARKDPNGRNCALILVGIVGVKDMKFPDAVGNVVHEGSEYQVYVPDGLKSLRYSGGNGSINGVVRFSGYLDNGVTVSNIVYRLVFETDSHQRMAIFKVTPHTATLTIDGQRVRLDADGIATIEKPVGSYRYQLSAPQYTAQTGMVVLTEDELSVTRTINMERVKHLVSIVGAPANANLTVDGESYGPMSLNDKLNLAEGTHTIHLQAEGYDDYKKTITVKAGMAPVRIAMNQKKLIEEFDETGTTHTRVNLRPGHYVSLAGNLFDKKKYDAQQWGLSINYSAMQHFAAIFALREGIGFGASFLDKDEMNNVFDSTPKDTTTLFIDVPLQIGISVPINSFNTCLFSIMAGGYGKYMWTELTGSSNDKNKDAWDYGLRLTALLELSKFTIGAEVSNSLNDKGLFYGLHIGYNMGRKNKK